jgi:hypothetical protein
MQATLPSSNLIVLWWCPFGAPQFYWDVDYRNRRLNIGADAGAIPATPPKRSKIIKGYFTLHNFQILKEKISHALVF